MRAGGAGHGAVDRGPPAPLCAGPERRLHLPSDAARPLRARTEGWPARVVAEVNAWVMIHPDETVVVRIARSEMGQGTLTGLSQLVAEELECDWAKVTTEYPTPGQNLARNRAWGNFSTGGSRGIGLAIALRARDETGTDHVDGREPEDE